MPKILTTQQRILIATSTLALVAFMPAPVRSQNIRIVDLAESRSSEQFFKQGRQQFELEIQKLQNPRLETPLLTIRSAIAPPTPIAVPAPEQLPAPPAIAPTPVDR